MTENLPECRHGHSLSERFRDSRGVIRCRACARESMRMRRRFGPVGRRGPVAVPLPERIASLVAIDENGCWIWQGGRFQTTGYARIKLPKAVGRRRDAVAHRVAYELLVGSVPQGKELDHLCRVRACVNPDHLEPVLHRTNVMRGDGLAAKNAAKTSCVHGHPFDEENTRLDKDGSRVCRSCKREEMRKRRKRERGRTP